MSRRRFYTRVNTDFETDPFSFTDVTGKIPNTVYASDPVQITGIFGNCPVSITTGEWQSASDSNFNNIIQDWTSSAGTIQNEKYIRVRRTSSSSYLTAVTTILTVGSESDTFSITTKAQPSPVTILLSNASLTTLQVPADWNSSNNYIECIGPGGNGYAQGSPGGGGGGYCRKNNVTLTPGANVSYVIGTPSASSGGFGSNTAFNGAFGATSGQTGSPMTAGVSPSGGVGFGGDVNRSGGNGGISSAGTSSSRHGGGGGHAGRPGGEGASGSVITAGGPNADSSTTEANGLLTGGGGTGGAAPGGSGGPGGSYGGGGGGGAVKWSPFGGGWEAIGAGGAGSKGCILLWYQPA
jgi:hypothetical protein